MEMNLVLNKDVALFYYSFLSIYRDFTINVVYVSKEIATYELFRWLF